MAHVDVASLSCWQAFLDMRHRRFQQFLGNREINPLKPAYCEYIVSMYMGNIPNNRNNNIVKSIKIYRIDNPIVYFQSSTGAECNGVSRELIFTFLV